MVSPPRWTWLLLAVVGIVGACSSGSDAVDALDEEPAVDEILTAAAAAMTEVESASFTLEQTGGEIYIDDAGQLSFLSAEGRFASPASSEALITVDALGFTTEIGAIAIDGELWFTNPLTGAWAVAPENITFDPATLFDADVGLPALLTEAATGSAELTDADSENGAGPYRVRTTVGADRVAVLTGGLVTESSEVDLAIDPDTSRVVEARFDLPMDDVVSSWFMTISDYDADVTIDPPELGASG